MRLLGFPPTSSEDILASGTQARQTQKAALTEVLRTSDTKLNATREALKEEALERTRKDERGPSSIRRTLEPFQRQR